MKNNIEFSYSTTNESPGYLLWTVHMFWQRKIKNELDKIGLTHAQFVLLSVLAMLSKSKKVITQTDIANHSKTDRMMVSKVLRTLEKKQYIIRTGSIHDTRIRIISLTENGTEIYQKSINIVEAVDTKFFSILNNDLQIFLKCMNTLSNQDD